jgi:hypothetical protein
MVTHSHRKSLWVIALIFSNGAILTLATRFYTTHYLMGAVFALVSFLVLYSPTAVTKPIHGFCLAILAGLCVWFSLLAKEVYFISTVLIIFFAARRHNFPVLIASVVALLTYLLMRLQAIGYSSEGRTGNSYVSELFRLNISQWLHFLHWYLSNKFFLVLLAATALLISARGFLANLLWALLFAAPSLAAPHSIIVPEQHADRVFFAFDCALVLAAIFSLRLASPVSRPVSTAFRKRFRLLHFSFKDDLLRPQGATIALSGALVILFLWQWSQANALAASVTDTANYRVSNAILEAVSQKDADIQPSTGVVADKRAVPDDVLTVYVPFGFQLGELMNVYRLLGQARLHITQNCHQVLSQQSDGQFIIFDNNGHTVPLSALQQHCKLVELAPEVLQPVQFKSGRLQWHFQLPGDYAVGVLFVDRALAVPLNQFSERLVRPKPGERYQLYAHRENFWWFSEIKPVLID